MLSEETYRQARDESVAPKTLALPAWLGSAWNILQSALPTDTIEETSRLAVARTRPKERKAVMGRSSVSGPSSRPGRFALRCRRRRLRRSRHREYWRSNCAA